MAEAKNLIKLSIGIIVLNIIYSVIVLCLLEAIGINLPGNKMHVEASFSFFEIIFIVVALEEAVFRLPLAIALFFRAPKWILISLICGLSTLFGYAHGSFANIAIQGVSGVAYSGLFLLAGGLEYNFRRAYLTCVLTHFAYDGVILTAVLILK